MTSARGLEWAYSFLSLSISAGDEFEISDHVHGSRHAILVGGF